MKKITKLIASRPVAVSCLVGAVVIGLAQMASGFAVADSSGRSRGKDTCAFSLQLQASVTARRQYLVRLDEALGGSAIAANPVEDMYGNIQPASYSPDDAAGAAAAPVGSAAYSFGSLFVKTKKVAKVVGLDSFSADCISCHDGVSASGIGVDLRDAPVGRRSQVDSFTSDHPIGMNYSNYVAVGRGYKHVGPGTKMVFVGGKVGCITCHDPLNQEKGHLVMSDRGSALCTTCHNK